MMKRNLVFLACLPFFAGCAANQEYGVDSPYYRFSGRLGLTLKYELAIPADQASVRLQFGQPVARNAVHEEEPHCIFEIDTVRPEMQKVQAEPFEVTRVQRQISSLSGLPVGPYWFGRDRPSHIYYITRFQLRSTLQPGVLSLTCQSNQATAGISIPRHLTVTEIREALGDWFSLDLP